jgi:hypothetical protein
MRLVDALAAGANGAESGTATFVLRGTSTEASSVMFEDFEGQTSYASNVVTLDAYGSAEVYVSAYVDISIASSDGTVLRTITAGDTAGTTEVISTSFTGQEYAGGGLAVSRPITLASVMDQWVTSSGAPDWEVLVAGSAVSLQAALASFAGMFFNVQDPTFGATGDGVTDDSASIAAAVTAANTAGGGIVFFPPGEYLCSVPIDLTNSDVQFMGSGPNATSIVADHSLNTVRVRSTSLTITDHRDVRISGIRFTSSPTNFPTACIAAEETCDLVVDNCRFDVRSFATSKSIDVDFGGVRTNVNISNCTFTAPAAQTSGIIATSDSGGTGGKSVRVNGCLFEAVAGFAGTVVLGPNVHQSNCEYDMTLCTGAYTCVDNDSGSGVYLGSVTGCTFRNAASTTETVFELTLVANGSNWSESGNVFDGVTEPADASESGNAYNVSISGDQENVNVQLGSRVGRSISFSGESSTSVTVLANVGYENVTIRFDGGSLVMSMPNFIFLPNTKIVAVNDGATGNVQVAASDGNIFTESSVGLRAAFHVANFIGQGSDANQIGTVVLSSVQTVTV